MSNYLFVFEPYKTKRNKHTCPSCGKVGRYTRYINTQNYQLLPYQYGKCDRINSCGYALNPYTDGYISGDLKPNIIQEKRRPNTPIYIPNSIQEASLKNYEQNVFIQYLIHLFGHQITDQLIAQFEIGTSNYWKGASVFWLKDQNRNICGGQVILFDSDGKTARKIRSDHRIQRFNSWVHIALRQHYKNEHQAIPNWLNSYIASSPKFPIPFGLHQLQTASKHKKIAIVESAKTAIIASAYLPQFIWMAIGGLTYLNAERLYPLRGRQLILFPDNGAYDIWCQKAQQLLYIAPIVVSDLLEQPNIESGSDLADYLIEFSIEDMQV